MAAGYLIFSGSDDFNNGLQNFGKEPGKQTDTLRNQILQLVGLSQNAAGWASLGLDIAAGAGAAKDVVSIGKGEQVSHAITAEEQNKQIAQIIDGEMAGANKPVKVPTADSATPKPIVVAELEVNGQKFTDTNQRARPPELANKDDPTAIVDRVDKKKKRNPDYPNGNMADAHAEIGAMEQAYRAGLAKDADLVINVTGRDVCNYCKGDISAMAKQVGAKSVTIHAIDEKNIARDYIWKPGMKTLQEIIK